MLAVPLWQIKDIVDSTRTGQAPAIALGAIIAARTRIVDGAVGMVEMALDRLEREQVVVLDEERKATMVRNLLVVPCGE